MPAGCDFHVLPGGDLYAKVHLAQGLMNLLQRQRDANRVASVVTSANCPHLVSQKAIDERVDQPVLLKLLTETRAKAVVNFSLVLVNSRRLGK